MCCPTKLISQWNCASIGSNCSELPNRWSMEQASYITNHLHQTHHVGRDGAKMHDLTHLPVIGGVGWKGLFKFITKTTTKGNKLHKASREQYFLRCFVQASDTVFFAIPTCCGFFFSSLSPARTRFLQSTTAVIGYAIQRHNALHAQNPYRKWNAKIKN